MQYALTRCIAVYPTSGTDNYQRIKVRLKNSGEVLSTSNSYTLVEGETNTRLDYKWYVGTDETVNIQFKGNDPDKTARTDVFYTVN